MNSKLKFILSPLSFIYRIAIFFWDLYWRKGPIVRLPARVISVGNLVVGGTGKTPLTIYLAKMAVEKGIKTSIVARGYGRSKGGLAEVSLNMSWERIGDEPLEILQSVPGARVYVCESKTRAAAKACADGAELIIVDDGFQHRRLYRDTNILCLDSKTYAGKDRLLPAGRLREPLSAMTRADIIVCTGEQNECKIVENGCEIRAFRFRIICMKLRKLGEDKEIDIESLHSRKFVAFCGLANPENFRISLVRFGFEIAEFVMFGDHHRYDLQDKSRLVSLARQHGGNLITTAKDAVKLKGFDFGDVEVYICHPEYGIDDLPEFRKVVGL